MKAYTIQSISEEGIYYLVNGWNKNKSFWVAEKDIHKALFKTAGQAKASLTKLLKVMPDYLTDIFHLCEVSEDMRVSLVPKEQANNFYRPRYLYGRTIQKLPRGGNSMTFKELRAKSGMTQKQFSEYFGIPRRTIENWETGTRKCPQYLLDLMEYKLNNESKHPVFHTKYDLGQEVFYGDKYERIKGEIITIYFDGTFNNIPKYEIEYNGNVWSEDEISDKE